MKNLIALLILIIIISCKNETKRALNGPESNTKTYFTNGKLKSEGAFFSKNKPIGEWTHYDSTGVLVRKAEYLKINGEAIFNQDWYFNKNGDTLNNKGSHFEIYYLSDTIKINEPVKAMVELTAPLFRNKNSEILIVIPKDYSVNFNEDFSNLTEVDLDTTYNLNLEKEMREQNGITTNFGKSAIFGRYFLTTGRKKFRGIIVEYFTTQPVKFDSINTNYFKKNRIELYHTYSDSVRTDTMKINYHKTHKYFEKDIIVIDSM